MSIYLYRDFFRKFCVVFTSCLSIFHLNFVNFQPFGRKKILTDILPVFTVSLLVLATTVLHCLIDWVTWKSTKKIPPPFSMRPPFPSRQRNFLLSRHPATVQPPYYLPTSWGSEKKIIRPFVSHSCVHPSLSFYGNFSVFWTLAQIHPKLLLLIFTEQFLIDFLTFGCFKSYQNRLKPSFFYSIESNKREFVSSGGRFSSPFAHSGRSRRTNVGKFSLGS